MSSSDPNNNDNSKTNPPPQPPQNPIPVAEINRNPAFGRVGPVISIAGFPRPNGELPNLAKTHAGLTLGRLRGAMKADEAVDTTGNTSRSNGGDGDVGSSGTTGGTERGGFRRAEQNDDDDDDDDDDGNDDDDDDDDDSSEPEIIDYKDGEASESELELERRVMTPPESPKQVYQVTDTLTHKLPPELVPDILEFAEYYPHQIIGKREDQDAVRSSQSKVYLKARVPDFDAFDEGTAGKGGDERMGGRPGRVRKLIFRLQSRDQGWSGELRWKGTYIGCWSWLEVELWRKADHVSANTSIEEGENGESENAVGAQPVEDGMVRVSGPHLLQRSKHATPEFTSHEIVWDWKEDEEDLPNDLQGRWEVDGDGQINEGCVKDGHERNGKFVRELRGGDEIRVIMRCRFPGWSCTVKRCEVECVWSV